MRLPHALALALLCFSNFACKGSAQSDSWLESGSDDETGEVELGCENEELGPPLLRRLTRDEFSASLVAVFPELGAQWDGLALGPDPISERGFSNDAALLSVGEQVAEEILASAEAAASELVSPEVLASLLPCSVDTPDIVCAETFIETRGRLLFRRTLQADELATYSDLFEEVSSTSDFATGLRWTLVALMQSPHFVYRFELGAEGAQGERELLDWEVATALSYTYAGVGPDEDLLARAQAGEFAQAQARVDAAAELMGAPQGEQILSRFFAEWIRYGRAGSKIKVNVETYSQVREDLVEETRLFVDRVVRQEGGSMRDLLTSDQTYLNAQLVSYYGWGEGTGSAYTSQTRPEHYSVGLLAQGSVLAGYAHTDSSSPTLRGLLIYEKLLCKPALAPPPDVPSIDPPELGEITTRERYELAHAGDPACASCHQFFDPLGFAFEHFDESGRYRETEGGLPIDTSASALVGSTMLSFSGLTEMAEGLAQEASVHACTGDNLERFAFGGEVEGCRALELRERLVKEEIGLADYFVELAGADGFARRSGPN